MNRIIGICFSGGAPQSALPGGAVPGPEAAPESRTAALRASRLAELGWGIRRTGDGCQGQVLAARPLPAISRGARGPSARESAARGRPGSPDYAATQPAAGSVAPRTSAGELWAEAGPFDQLRAEHERSWVKTSGTRHAPTVLDKDSVLAIVRTCPRSPASFRLRSRRPSPTSSASAQGTRSNGFRPETASA